MLTFSPQAIADLQRDLLAFLPELVLCAAIVLMLLIRLFPATGRTHLGGLALLAVGGALVVAWLQWTRSGSLPLPDTSVRYFTGLLAYDSLTVFLRLFLLGFVALAIVLTFFTHIPDSEDSGDFYVLLLGGTVGMMLMASANHLLMVYMAVEMASLPSYALVGFTKGRRASSEAALKYVVYGGGAAGVMLYGISLVAGRFGTGSLTDVAQGVGAALATGTLDVPLALGLAFIFIGLAFKLSAVPFHFWCPDVFEGAPAEIGAFLSVASKGAAMALAGRLVLAFAAVAPEQAALAFAPVLALFAAVTATFGNLAAYSQTNLKRLLAYSTIAHAGYMMMALACVNTEGMSAVLFYLVTYLFTNLGAFAVIALIRNRTGSEDLSAYAGLVYTAPGLVVAMGVFLLSLLGLPPLAGFAGKFVIFSAVYHAAADASRPWLAQIYWALFVIGGLNTVISAVYYVRALKVMVIDKPPEGVGDRRVPFAAGSYAAILAMLVFVLGIAWNMLSVASERGTASFPAPKATVAAKG
ncbi:MAG: NADH-quinone oxidoreductase subunit N [Gemmataceae bacterium]|nr:NADH-quinone oxidoreductase subunit N [Gemmataceae bacterium]